MSDVFFQIVDVVFIDDSFDSLLSKVRGGCSQVLGWDDESGWMDAVGVRICMVLDQEVDRGYITRLYGCVNRLGQEVLEEFEFLLGVFFGFTNI